MFNILNSHDSTGPAAGDESFARCGVINARFIGYLVIDMSVLSKASALPDQTDYKPARVNQIAKLARYPVPLRSVILAQY